MTIDTAYTKILSQWCDVSAHLPRLFNLAKGVKVVEFGTRAGMSTISMLAGRPISLTTYDIGRCNEISEIEAMAKDAGIPFRQLLQDINHLTEIEACDFVFCDAEHNGNAVWHQLVLADAAGASVIASHDTELFGRSGDYAHTPGILDAMDRFIAERPQWKISAQFFDDYGLTVLRKTP
jgi:predicted O-methyltransferase YrrM